jgi:serine/threonine protein phosphatase PrpC
VLVVASDGIWDYISKEDIAEMVVPYFEGREIERACDKLLQCAVERWTEEDDDIVDDITFVLIFLRP